MTITTNRRSALQKVIDGEGMTIGEEISHHLTAKAQNLQLRPILSKKMHLRNRRSAKPTRPQHLQILNFTLNSASGLKRPIKSTASRRLLRMAPNPPLQRRKNANTHTLTRCTTAVSSAAANSPPPSNCASMNEKASCTLRI